MEKLKHLKERFFGLYLFAGLLRGAGYIMVSFAVFAYMAAIYTEATYVPASGFSSYRPIPLTFSLTLLAQKVFWPGLTCIVAGWIAELCQKAAAACFWISCRSNREVILLDMKLAEQKKAEGQSTQPSA